MPAQPTPDQLREQNAKLQAALAAEKAAAVVARHRLPPSFVSLIADTPPEEQDAKAQQIAHELQERTGHPAGRPPGLRDQEREGSPTGGEEPGGDLVDGEVEGESGEYLEPEHLSQLAAVTKSGSEGANPPTPPGESGGLSEQIAGAKSFSELEQLQESMRNRRR